MKAGLDDIGKVDVSEGMRKLIEKLREVLPQMRGLKTMAGQVVDTINNGPSKTITPAADYQDRAAQAETTRQLGVGQKVLDEDTRRNALTDSQKALEDEIKRLRETIIKAGGKVDEGAVRTQAQANLDARGGNSAISSFADRVVGAESSGDPNARPLDKSGKPLSSALGLGQFIESTWLKLFKKYFPDEAKGLNDPAILALRTNSEKSKALIELYAKENADALKAAGIAVNSSADEYKLQLAHFLGPQGAINVLKAAPGTLAASVLDKKSVAANPTILGNGRTVDDVIAYGQKRAGMSNAGTARVDAQDNFDQYLKEQQRSLDQMKEETGLRANLNPLVDDYGQKLTSLQKAQELLSHAQDEGTAAGRELSSAHQLLYGDLSKLTPEAQAQATAMRALAEGYGQSESAANKSAEAQDRLRETMQETSSMGKDVLGGFIKDLRDGKSATEALGSALEKIGDKALDNFIGYLFDGDKANSGGGIFTKFLGSLFSSSPLKLATGGTVRGPGGPTGDKIPTMLSDGEHVTRAAMAKKYRPLLDAINGDRIPHLAAGTPQLRAPVMPNLQGVAVRGRSVNQTIRSGDVIINGDVRNTATVDEIDRRIQKNNAKLGYAQQNTWRD